MITLNLLPTIQKEKIKKMAICSLCENLIVSVFVSLSIIGAVFLISDNILQNNLIEFTAKTTGLPSQRQGLDMEIKKINSELKIINSIQGKFIKWSDFLLVLNETIPEKVRLTNIEIKSKNVSDETGGTRKSLALTGTAAMRDDLLKFQKNLENHPIFLEIESPISNILQQKNIEFTLNVQLDNLNK